MPGVRFIPDERGETALRILTRTRNPERRRLPGLWAVGGTLELDFGGPEPLRARCASPLTSGLEPLTELAAYAATGQPSWRNRALGTARLGRASHLYYRWRGEYEAVLSLLDTNAALGVTLREDSLALTVLETDDQPKLEDESFALLKSEVAALPLLLWDDLDALLRLLEIDLEPRERAKWERMRAEAVFGPGQEPEV